MFNKYKKSLELNHSRTEEFFTRYQKEIAWVIEKNTISTDDYYHNTRHLIGVALLAYILSFDGESNEKIITNKGLRDNLIIAALLHDFQHAGSEDDVVNIDFTLSRIQEEDFFLTFPYAEFGDISKIIRATLYRFDQPLPGVETGKAGPTAVNKIIRDADQLYGTIFFDDAIFKGLYNELGKRFGLDTIEFIDRNIAYIKNNKYYTEYAEELAESPKYFAIAHHQAMKWQLSDDINLFIASDRFYERADSTEACVMLIVAPTAADALNVATFSWADEGPSTVFPHWDIFPLGPYQPLPWVKNSVKNLVENAANGVSILTLYEDPEYNQGESLLRQVVLNNVKGDVTEFSNALREMRETYFSFEEKDGWILTDEMHGGLKVPVWVAPDWETYETTIIQPK